MSKYKSMVREISNTTPSSDRKLSRSSRSSISSQRSFQIIPSMLLNSSASTSIEDNALMDDYEETTSIDSPNLLATSVESNKLLPSTSTISLLSLNRPYIIDEPISSSINPQKMPIKKKTSFSSTRVGSFQRHTHSPFIYNQRRPSSHTIHPLQPIPILSSNRKSNIAPDSPELNPVSVSCSPSGFMLSQQTLPSSLQKQNHFNAPTPILTPITPSLGNRSPAQLATGNMSPFLAPTALDVPMTPLMLSSPQNLKQEDELD